MVYFRGPQCKKLALTLNLNMKITSVVIWYFMNKDLNSWNSNITLFHVTQEERNGSSLCGPTLTSWVEGQQKRHPDKDLSLVVIDLEKYFR